MVDNIIIKTPMGYYFSHDSILVYDDIHGGLGLVQHLFDELPQYVRKLVIPENKTDSNADTSERHSAARVKQENAQNFLRWLEQEPGPQDDPIPQPDGNSWWRVVTNGSEVKIYLAEQTETLQGTVMNRYWDDGIKYHVKVGSEVVNLVDEDLQLAGSNFDFELWQPKRNETRHLSNDS